MRERIVDLALDAPELSPRELATRFTDKESYFVSEASVYRLLKNRDDPMPFSATRKVGALATWEAAIGQLAVQL